MTKVLVTGGAGFIGSNLVKKYLEEGFEVVIVDNLSTGKETNIPNGIRFYKTDICSSDFLEIVKKEQPDIINHHAAQIDIQKSIKDPVFDAKVNILGTVNVLEACKELGDKVTLVYASSAAVYGDPSYLGVDEKHIVNPLSYYGISKHTPEHYIKTYHELYGINFSILRYANVYGIGQDPKGEGGVISILVEKGLKNTQFTVFGDGEQTRDYIFVEDIVSANLLASKKAINTIVNIGTGKATTLNELIDVFQEVIGGSMDVHYTEPRKGDILHSYFNITEAERLLGWTPKNTLKEGIGKTFTYYKNVNNGH